MGREPYLDVTEVAVILKVDRYTVRKYLIEEKLKGNKLNGYQWRIHPDDLQEFINRK